MATYGPDCWTEKLLTRDQMGEICDWLMAIQKAQVTAQCLMADGGELAPGDVLAQQEWEARQFRRAMAHVQGLVRHLGALQGMVFGTEEDG